VATGSAGSFPVLSVEVKTAAALDAELARPRYPEMVGVAEVAAMLGVSRQRVSVLLRNHRRFPHRSPRSPPVRCGPRIRLLGLSSHGTGAPDANAMRQTLLLDEQ
jgi:hypothetical protein